MNDRREGEDQSNQGGEKRCGTGGICTLSATMGPLVALVSAAICVV